VGEELGPHDHRSRERGESTGARKQGVHDPIVRKV